MSKLKTFEKVLQITGAVVGSTIGCGTAIGGVAGGTYGCAIGVSCTYDNCMKHRSDCLIENVTRAGLSSMYNIPAHTIVHAAMGAIAGLTFPISIPLAIHMTQRSKD